MRAIMPDLWETETEYPAPGLTTHAYLLTRPQGNILFYNTNQSSAWPAIEKLGGIDWQMLSHEDEVGHSLQTIRRRFAAKLAIHETEYETAAAVQPPDHRFTDKPQQLAGIDIIPTPGHTTGSVCFQTQGHNGKQYLFTGDTLYRAKHGHWRAGMIDGHSDRRQLRESLHLLRRLTPDVVLSSAFTGDSGYQEVTETEWRTIVDNALSLLGRCDRR